MNRTKSVTRIKRADFKAGIRVLKKVKVARPIRSGRKRFRIKK